MIELRLKNRRLRAGDTIEVSLHHYEGPASTLELLLTNIFGSFPEQGPKWRLESSGEVFYASITIPNEPLHNPDGGEYRLRVLDAAGVELASTPLYISHWQQQHYYGELALIPRPQRCFYEGLCIATPLSEPVFVIRDEDPVRAERLAKFAKKSLLVLSNS